jgi:RNA polymerase sigma-70 factor (ECF subfamily)
LQAVAEQGEEEMAATGNLAAKCDVGPTDRVVEKDCLTENDFKAELVTHLSAIRALARSLCGGTALADDLTQEALIKAWASRDSFTAGTNMRAWLCTILRNVFYSHIRRHAREIQDVEGIHAGKLVAQPEQQGHVELQDLAEAMQRLPDDQREALILVAAAGFSYEEAADICGCAVGTIKSRVSRARQTLLQMFEGIDSGGQATRPRLSAASLSAMMQVSLPTGVRYRN